MRHARHSASTATSIPVAASGAVDGAAPWLGAASRLAGCGSLGTVPALMLVLLGPEPPAAAAAAPAGAAAPPSLLLVVGLGLPSAPPAVERRTLGAAERVTCSRSEPERRDGSCTSAGGALGFGRPLRSAGSTESSGAAGQAQRDNAESSRSTLQPPPPPPLTAAALNSSPPKPHPPALQGPACLKAARLQRLLRLLVGRRNGGG